MGFFSRLFAGSSGGRSATADQFARVLHNAAVKIADSIHRNLASLGALQGQPPINYSSELMIYALAPLDFILTSGLSKHPPATVSRLRAAMHRDLIEVLLRQPAVRTEEQWRSHITERFDRYSFAFGSGDVSGLVTLAATALGLRPHALTEMALHESFLATLENYPDVINAANIVD